MICGPGGASGVRLKSKAPLSWASADSLGLSREGQGKVECQGGMWDEAVPDMQREVWVAAAQDGDEVILVSLDFSFCGVGAMQVWGHELKLDNFRA